MSKIKMQAVRICWPNLFSTALFGGEDTGKYDSTFILDKKDHAETIKEIEQAIALITKEKWKGKSLSEDRICLKDGDDTDREEYQNAYTIKAATKQKPLVIDRDKRPLSEDDNVIYAGCYVNAIVTLWAQNNQFGKRINASLEGVQFVRDGEPLGGGGVDVDEFDVFEQETDEMPF